MLLDGDSDYISVPDSDDWHFNGNNFTIDFRLRFNAIQTCILAQQWSGTGRSFELFFASNALYFEWSTNGTSVSGSENVSWSPSVDTWYHIAVTRDGTNLKFFVDGTQVGTTKSISGNLFNSSEDLVIGADGASNFVCGWIDELRILNGHAAWTSNFTPPTQEYKNASASSSSSSP